LARSIANVQLRFGMVAFPIRVCVALKDTRESFRKLCSFCNTPVEQPAQCPTCNRRLEQKETIRGYEYTPGKYVSLTLEELKAIKPGERPVFEVRKFVSSRSVDPLLFAEFYYLEPGKGGEKPYALLNAALRETNSLGRAYVVLRERAREAFVKARGKSLLLIMARDPSSIVSPGEVSFPSVDVDRRELDIAKQLILLLKGPFSLKDLEVGFSDIRKAERDLIETKLKGGVVTTSRVTSVTKDLADVLKESIDAARKRKNSE